MGGFVLIQVSAFTRTLNSELFSQRVLYNSGSLWMQNLYAPPKSHLNQEVQGFVQQYQQTVRQSHHAVAKSHPVPQQHPPNELLSQNKVDNMVMVHLSQLLQAAAGVIT